MTNALASLPPIVPLAAGPGHHFLPAPLWLLDALHVLTLTLHLAAMNFLLGGILIVLVGRFDDRWNHPVVRRLTWLFPSLMAATVTLGVAPLLFLQLVYGRTVYAASIVSAWWWLLIPFVVMAGYYLLYAVSFRVGRGRRPALLLGLALLGLLYVSLTYSSVFSLAERPDTAKAIYAGNASGFAVHDDLGYWGLRWLHMVLGAVTVGGFFVGWVGRDDPQGFANGKRFFLGGMVAASVSGLAWLFTFGDDLAPFMRTTAPWYLLVAIVLVLGSLHLYFKRKVTLAGLPLLLSLLGMVAVRHELRRLRLPEAYDPAAVPLEAQWDVFVLFVVCLLAAVGLMAWMLRTFFRRGDAGTA